MENNSPKKEIGRFIVAFALAAGATLSYASENVENEQKIYDAIQGVWQVKSNNNSTLVLNFRENSGEICAYIETIQPGAAREFGVSVSQKADEITEQAILCGLIPNSKGNKLVSGKFLNITNEDALNATVTASFEGEKLELTARLSMLFSKTMAFQRVKGHPIDVNVLSVSVTNYYSKRNSDIHSAIPEDRGVKNSDVRQINLSDRGARISQILAP